MVEDLFNFIPDEDLARIGEEHNVDWNVSRLKGEYMLKLLVYGMICDDNLSTHSLESLYNSLIYSVLSGKGGHQTYHSTIAARLGKMPPAYLESVFELLLERLAPKYLADHALSDNVLRFDSSMRSISRALIDRGMRVGAIPKDGNRKAQLKVTVGLRGEEGWPEVAEHTDDQAHLSEERTLKEVIEHNADPGKDIVVVDMGLSNRKTLASFDSEGLSFVTRGGQNLRYQIIETHTQTQDQATDELNITEDLKVYLFQSSNRCLEHPFRLVKGVDSEGNEFSFITNIWDLSAEQIAQLYRMRWGIEVFFRFIKQELNFSHLLNRSINGILNQIYATMITSVLLMAFKKQAEINGYKDAVTAFEHALITLVIKELTSNLEAQEINGLLQGRSELFVKLLS